MAMSEAELRRQKEELARVKADESALRQAYRDAGGKESSDSHSKCIACEHPSGLSFFEKNDIHQFKCWQCGRAGTIVDVVMATKKCGSQAAIVEVLEKYGSGTARAGAPAKPKQELKSHRDPDSAFEAALWGIQQRGTQTNRHGDQTFCGDAKYVRKWVYPRANCDAFGQVARFDIPCREAASGETYVSKEFRPVTFFGNGWKLTARNAKNEKWPLYRAPELRKALEVTA